LLQRDYWAVLADCRLKPSEVMARVKAQFCELPPRELVSFTAAYGISTGAELDILLMPRQHCRVRVVHDDEQSLTLATLEGHPEAGRITFGSYRNSAGDVIFHIRSRARSSSTAKRLGFLAVGDAMQTNTWTDFIVGVAAAAGVTIREAIHADTDEVAEVPDDEEPLRAPTFRAVGD
jgi:hypothetical protein